MSRKMSHSKYLAEPTHKIERQGKIDKFFRYQKIRLKPPTELFVILVVLCLATYLLF